MNANDLPADDQRIGRYSIAELTAMRGRRGRKPPEFYRLFPELSKPAIALGASIAEEPRKKPMAQMNSKADRLAERIRAAPAAVRQIILALLDYTDGSSRTASDVPESFLGSVPSKVEVVAISVSQAPVHQDPVYADPELDVRGVHEDACAENDIEPEVSHSV